MQCKKVSNLAIFQDFTDARPMPSSPQLQSRFVSIEINQFRLSKTFNSCLVVLLFEAGYNYSTHRPGISNLWLWRIILEGRNVFFYVLFFTIFIFVTKNW